MRTPGSGINRTTMCSWCLQLSVFASLWEYILALERRVKGGFYERVKRLMSKQGVASLALLLWLHYLFIPLLLGKTQALILTLCESLKWNLSLCSSLKLTTTHTYEWLIDYFHGGCIHLAVLFSSFPCKTITNSFYTAALLFFINHTNMECGVVGDCCFAFKQVTKIVMKLNWYRV